MLDNIKAYFAPPQYPDFEDNRKSRLFNATVLAASAITAIYLPILPIVNANSRAGVLTLGVFLFLFITVYVIFRRGFMHIAIQSMLAAMWVILAFSAFYNGGVISPGFVSSILIIYAAGILSNDKTATYYTGFTAVWGMLLVILHYLNALPVTLTPNTPIAFYVGILFNFVTIAFFSKTTNEAMKGNILESSHHHAHLEEKNFELQKANTNLQATVNLRTEELARRTSYLEAAALVARETTSILNPDKLLDSVVDLIAEKYDFYHVGIFLVDEENQFAVLSAASSEGGKQMVARNHRLGVGKQGIVGFVTGIGQARLSQDIEKDQIHSTTEELPETRSELAVPLKIGGQIIGALDIQDNTPEAFSQDDVTTLQILADQIALAIQNARLYERAEESISEAQKLIGQFDQQSWLDSVHRGELVTYRYNSKSQLEAEKLAHGETLSQDEHGKVEIPINVRGLNIGSIDIVKEHNQAWSEDELSLLKSLSDQLGIALDSARLFSETQLRAANEHLVSDISNQVRGNLDVNSILKTTANKVRESLGLPEVTIRMAPPSESTVTNGSGQPEV